MQQVCWACRHSIAKVKIQFLNLSTHLELFGIGQSWGGFESLALYQNDSVEMGI